MSDYEKYYSEKMEMVPVVVSTIHQKSKKSKKGKKILSALCMVAVSATIFGAGVGITNWYYQTKIAADVQVLAETQLQLETLTAESQLQMELLTTEMQEQLDALADQLDDTKEDFEGNYIRLVSENSNASVSDVFKRVKDSVVSINMTVVSTGYFNQLTEDEGAGSGIIFSEDSEKIYIVTNYHVIDSASSVNISLDDKTTVKAQFVGGDSKADIAVIAVLKNDLAAAGIKNYTIATFSDSSQWEVGDIAIAVGNALGEGKSATLGIISAADKQITIEGITLDVIQTDAAINPGNSGGALVASNGEVIGINTAKLSSSGVEGMGYAIPSNVVVELIEEIMENGSIERPFLGIENYVVVTDEIQEQYGLASTGIYVNGVIKNSTAAVAGLQNGDIITHLNGKEVMTEDELSTAISQIPVGSPVTITVVRTTSSRRGSFMYGGQPSSQTLTLQATMLNYTTGTNF